MTTLRHFCVLLFVAASPLLAHADWPQFTAETIDAAVAQKACYAVCTADVDGDGKQDIVAVSENQVLWYHNPDWKKHIIIENQTELDNVCIAPYDIDGDGKVDFALGAGWTKVGTIQWLSRGESLDEKWHVHAIDTEIWTHRMRWANVLGKDRPQLVVSPLNAVDRPGVRLLAFEIPANPRTDRWSSVALDDSLNRMHNHWHIDFNGDGIESTLTASQEGLNLIKRQEDGTFSRQLVGTGIAGEKPADQGAGEVKVGRLKDGRPYMATIEPMHGTSVAVYFAPPKLPPGQLADRLVIDDTLKQGHAVWTVDLDGDGDDELIIGHREAGTGKGTDSALRIYHPQNVAGLFESRTKPEFEISDEQGNVLIPAKRPEPKGPGIYIYDPQDGGKRWVKHVLDNGGIAVEDLVCEDLNGDGRPDIIAGGRATLNLKVYWNQKP